MKNERTQVSERDTCCHGYGQVEGIRSVLRHRSPERRRDGRYHFLRCLPIRVSVAELSKQRALFLARTLVSAVPIAGTFVCYALVRQTGQPIFGLDAELLGLGVEVEFIVLHSIGFLGLLALVRPPRAEWAMLKWLAVALLGSMYLNGAHNMGGSHGVLLFLSLTIATYLGFFLRFMSSGAAVSLAVRWFISLALLGVASGISGVEGDLEQVAWSDPNVGLRLGQWYFGLLLAVEITGIYQLRFWDELGDSLSTEFHKAIPVTNEPWLHRVALGLVPLIGTVLLCLLPLLVAQAIGAGFYELMYKPYGPSLDERVDWMRAQGNLHEWGPVIATAMLLVGRCVQISWIASVLANGGKKELWRGKGKSVMFGIIGLAYVATGWSLASDGEQVIRGGVSPTALYSHFVLAEMLLLLALIPLTWIALVRRLRGALG